MQRGFERQQAGCGCVVVVVEGCVVVRQFGGMRRELDGYGMCARRSAQHEPTCCFDSTRHVWRVSLTLLLVLTYC